MSNEDEQNVLMADDQTINDETTADEIAEMPYKAVSTPLPIDQQDLEDFEGVPAADEPTAEIPSAGKAPVNPLFMHVAPKRPRGPSIAQRIGSWLNPRRLIVASIILNIGTLIGYTIRHYYMSQPAYVCPFTFMCDAESWSSLNQAIAILLAFGVFVGLTAFWPDNGPASFQQRRMPLHQQLIDSTHITPIIYIYGGLTMLGLLGMFVTGHVLTVPLTVGVVQVILTLRIWFYQQTLALRHSTPVEVPQ